MNFYNISKSDLTSRIAPASHKPLRSGQIIQGSVLQLYPDNKAGIQLGGKRMIANLEVGLQVGAKYHFQVQSTANVIQLKVLGEELKGKSEVDTSRLLHQLGLRDSKANINLVNNLFRARVPFDHQQLADAVQLLKNQKDKPAATNIITEMIARKLPVRLSVFQALSEVNQSTATDRLLPVMEQINNTPPAQSNIHPLINSETKDALLHTISALTDKAVPFRTAFTQAVLERSTGNNPALFRTLQGLGLVSLNTDFTQWTSEWKAFADKAVDRTVTNQTPLPFQFNEQTMMQALSKVSNQKNDFVTAITKFMSQWNNQLNFHYVTQSAMTDEDFTSLQQIMKQDILPHFSESQRAVFSQLANSPGSLSALYQAMQSLTKGDELANLLQFMQKAVTNEQFLALAPKEQFLQHKNLFMQSFGLDYENQLLHLDQSNKQVSSIKGLLLQLLSVPESTQTEANQKLLHFINGMQIKSVNETQSILQANIQIPAERLGLIKDIEMEFEGRKTKNGEIDPDFCRILFHLNLQRLEETVIDMNIHQRKISLTVFNNHEAINLTGSLLRDKLKANLETLGYEMIGLQYKKIEEKSRTGVNFEQPLYASDDKGVDFRI